jgi:hypothetical protein
MAAPKKSTSADTANSDKNSARTRGLKPFQPGQSGNPSGRPKKSLFAQKMEDAFNNPEVVELLMADVLTSIREGNSANLKEAWARVDGPIKQEMEVTGSMGVEIAFQSAVDKAYGDNSD